MKSTPVFLSKRSFEKVIQIFSDLALTQKTERYSLVADILDDEPPTSWASVIELAFRCQRGDFPASPSWEKKEFSQKPISMSNKAYSETNKKYKEILADVEEAVKSASDESERYSSLVKILKVHKSRVKRTFILIRASIMFDFYHSSDHFETSIKPSLFDESMDLEEETGSALSISDIIEENFCDQFSDVFSECPEAFNRLKARIDPEEFKKFCLMAKKHLSSDQLKLLLGEKFFQSFSRPETVEFTTKEELELAIMGKPFPEWLSPQLKKQWQLLRSTKETSVIDVQSRKLRALINMDWNHPLAEVSRQDFISRMKEQYYGRDDFITKLAETLTFSKYQVTSQYQTPFIWVGGSGIGKTALAKAFANSIGRAFVEINLSAHSDPEAIFGTADVFVNGMYGLLFKKVIQKYSDAPVLFIDESDKVFTRTGTGSIVNGLLELTESGRLEDHFIGFPIDLSRAIVILAVNDLSALPAPLRNRCHIIEIDDYNREEKEVIAKDYIWKNIQSGLDKSVQCPVSEEAIRLIVEHGQDETGLRKVRRILQDVARYSVDQFDQGNKLTCIDEEVIKKLIGFPRHKKIEDLKVCGSINGLAVSEHLGRILRIESIVQDSVTECDSFRLFGNASEVMKESAELAFEVLKRKQKLEHLQTQVHFEDAALKKDGPSAGLAIYLSLYSSLTKLEINQAIAVTGELSLHGKVFPVGAIAEKLRAAKKAGCKWVIIPKDNLPDVPSDLSQTMKIIPVSDIEEAIAWLQKNN